ncbi:MAG: hypothetical protein R2774_12660 [Saprospiraceae bacterium]
MFQNLNEDVSSMFDDANQFSLYSSDTDLNTINVGIFTSESTFSHQVLMHFNGLSAHFKNLNICYFGDVHNMDSNYNEITQECARYNILPIFIGIHDNVMYSAIKNLEILHLISNKLTNLASNPKKLNFIGYQRHINSYMDTLTLENLYPNAASLGKISTYPFIIEPILRDAELVHCNLNVLKSSELPNSSTATPTGMTAEQFCQMGKYIGLSNHLKCLGIAPAATDYQNQMEAKLTATFLWYVLEGINMKNNSHPSTSNSIQSFVVTNSILDEELTFVQNNDGKYWLKLEHGENIKYIACAEEEFKSCLNNEFPVRLQKYFELITE